MAEAQESPFSIDSLYSGAVETQCNAMVIAWSEVGEVGWSGVMRRAMTPMSDLSLTTVINSSR